MQAVVISACDIQGGKSTHSLVHVYVLEVQKHGEKEAACKQVPLDLLQHIRKRGKATIEPTFLALSIDHRSIPNMKPLYWK